jgi:hypothetical protein
MYRKSLAVAAAVGALALPLALAIPAAADPTTCANAVNGTKSCDYDGLRVNVHVGNLGTVGARLGNGGTCDSDTLLLVQVRADQHGSHQRVIRAESAYGTAQADLKAKQDAYNAAVAGHNANPPTATQADVDRAKNARDVAQTNADAARRELQEARDADSVLLARISLLGSRIHGTECTTPTPVPPTTDVPVPTDTPAPPVIVGGPTIVNNPPAEQSQVGQAPQGFVSAGGGADAAAVESFS